ncbi:guanine nucleotide-binding protein G(s) subunit alpha isoforms XLas-like [Oncorhynchus nerka]|uniref:guanine nucleotide-binding protein G(s) subunit alpha isoforms XLas-like n=1 Tax=Oncorhynchus nerka TaxID=8023 RepID=UPI0031B80963
MQTPAAKPDSMREGPGGHLASVTAPVRGIDPAPLADPSASMEPDRGSSPEAPDCGPSPEAPDSRPSQEVPDCGPSPEAPECGPSQEIPNCGPSQEVPDCGPSQEVPDCGPSQEVPDSGPSQEVPDCGPSQEVPDCGPSQDVPDWELSPEALDWCHAPYPLCSVLNASTSLRNLASSSSLDSLTGSGSPLDSADHSVCLPPKEFGTASRASVVVATPGVVVDPPSLPPPASMAGSCPSP